MLAIFMVNVTCIIRDILFPLKLRVRVVRPRLKLIGIAARHQVMANTPATTVYNLLYTNLTMEMDENALLCVPSTTFVNMLENQCFIIIELIYEKTKCNTQFSSTRTVVLFDPAHESTEIDRQRKAILQQRRRPPQYTIHSYLPNSLTVNEADQHFWQDLAPQA